MYNINMTRKTDDIIESSKLASIAKEKNPKVINATIGVLHDENGNIVTYKSVSSIVNSIPAKDYYGYSSVDGGKDFHNNCLKFIFSSHSSEFSNLFEIATLPTPGSTLAIYLTFSLFSKKCKNVILPSYYWSNYDNMISLFKIKKHHFNYLTKSGFDFDSFSKLLNEVLATNDSVMILLNDPANNPTGYSLTVSEWNNIINLLNSYQDKNIILINDIAYLDFKEGEIDQKRDYFIPFKNLDKNITLALCCSGSKSFAAYGLRIGALILLSKKYKNIYKLSKLMLTSARSIWSTIPSAGLYVFNTLSNNSIYYDMYLDELKYSKAILERRANLFLYEAESVGLRCLPYKSGFFITIKTLTPNNNQKELMKNNIYCVAVENGLRVAICSININEIRGLAIKIKEIINK